MAYTTTSVSSTITSCPLTASSITPVVVSLSGSLIPTNTISLSSATIGNLTTSTSSCSSSASIHCSAYSTRLYGAKQISSLKAHTTGTMMNMSTTSSSSALPYTSTPSVSMTTFMNTTSTSTNGQSVSSLSTSCILATSAPSIYVSTAGNIVSTTTISTALTPIVPGPSTASSTCTISSKYDTKDDHVEYARICRAINDLGRDILKDLLKKHIDPKDLPNEVRRKRYTLPKLNKDQMKLINNTPADKYNKLDVSLLCTLLSNLCPIVAPSSGWHSDVMPTSSETTPGDDIKKIRILRNKMYGHVADTSEAGRGSSMLWSELGGICSRMDAVHGTNYTVSLHDIQTTDMDSRAKRKHNSKLKFVKRKKKKKCHKINSLNRGRNALQRHQNRFLIEREELEQACLDALRENFCLLVTGSRGSGKSTLCLEIVRQLSEEESLDIYMLQEPEEWLSVNLSSENEVAILIDDFCDEAILRSNKYENWKQHFEDMTKCAQDGKAYIVIAVETNLLSKIQMEVPDNYLFHPMTHFDLTSDWNLSVVQKRRYFELMFESCTESFKCNLTESDLSEICECKPQMGFFRVCQSFFDNQENYEKGVKYFKQAEIDYSSLVENLYSNDFIQFAVIFCTLVLGQFDLSENSLSMLIDVCSGFGWGSPSPDEVRSAIDALLHLRLVDNLPGGQVFKVIDVAQTLPLVAKHNVQLFLEMGRSKVISYIRTESYKPRPEETCVCVSSDQYSLLSVILFNEFRIESIKNDNLEEKCLSHPACSDRYFLDFLFERMTENWPMNTRTEYFTHILNWSCFKGNANLLEKALFMFDSDIMTPDIFNKALLQVCYCESDCECVMTVLAECEYITLMKAENILPLIKTSHLKPKILKNIIGKIKISDEEIKSLILEILVCRSIDDSVKETLLRLLFRLSNENLLTLISLLAKEGWHNVDFIIRPLRRATFSLKTLKNEAYTSILETFLQSHTDPDVYLSFIRDWEKNESFSKVDSEEIFRLLFRDPVEKPWNKEEYLTDVASTITSKTLDMYHVKEVIKHCFHKGISTKCIEYIVQKSGHFFYKIDICRLLLELFDTHRRFEKYLYKAFEMMFVRNVFERCHIRVLANLFRLNLPPTECKILVSIVVISSLCSEKSEILNYLQKIETNGHSVSGIDVYEYLFSAHLGMTPIYFENFVYCILHCKLLKSSIFEYIRSPKRVQSIPTIIYHFLIEFFALERGIISSKVEETHDRDDKTLMWNILSFINRNIEMEKMTVLDIFGVLVKRSDIMLPDTLFIAITIALDKRFSDSAEESFNWINLFLHSITFIENDVLQSIFMKMVEFDKMAEMDNRNVELLLSKVFPDSEPSVSSNSIMNILHYACKSEFKNKEILLLLIDNSNILSLGHSRLLRILHEAVKCRSYSVLNALIDCQVLPEICEKVKLSSPPRDVDALCTAFLMMSTHPQQKSKNSELVEFWGKFFEISTNRTKTFAFSLLRKIVKAYSVCEEFQVDLLMKYMRNIQHKRYFDVSLIYNNITAKWKGNNRLANEIVKMFVWRCPMSYLKKVYHLVQSSCLTLEIGTVVTFYFRMYSALYGESLDDELPRKSLDNDSEREGSDNDLDRESLNNDFDRESFGGDIDRESSDTDLDRESFDDDMDRESSDNDLDRESFGEDMDRESSDNDLDRESFDDDMDRESFGDDTDRESSDNDLDMVIFGDDLDGVNFGDDMDIESSDNDLDRESFGDDLDMEGLNSDLTELTLVLSKTSYYGTIRNFDIFVHIWKYEFDIPPTLSNFLSSIVFPSLDSDGISLAVKQSILHPLSGTAKVFAEYMKNDRDDDNLSALLDILSKPLHYGMFDAADYDNADVILVNQLCLSMVKTPNTIQSLNVKDKCNESILHLLNLLFLLRMKREKCLFSIFSFVIPVRCTDISPCKIVYVIQYKRLSMCTITMVCENMQQINVYVEFNPEGVVRSLCVDRFTSADDFLMSVISAVACSGLRNSVNDLFKILCCVHGRFDHVQDRRFSLPTGGYIINIKELDIYVVYICHLFIGMKNEVKDSLMERIRFSEMSLEEYSYLKDTDELNELFFCASIYTVLECFNSAWNLEGSSTIDNETYEYPFLCHSIISSAFDEQTTYTCYVFLRQQVVNFDIEEDTVDFILDQSEALNGLQKAIFLRYAVFCNVPWDLTKDIVLSSFNPTMDDDDSYLHNANCLEHIVKIWRSAKFSIQHQDRLIKILSLADFQEVVSSTVQRLSDECILEYLEISVRLKQWNLYKLFIQHESITPGILRKAFYLLLERKHENNQVERDFNDVFNITVSHTIPLQKEDLICIVNAFEDSCLSKEDQYLKTPILTQCLVNQDGCQVHKKFALDYFTMDGLRDSETQVIRVDLQKPSNITILSRLLKTGEMRKGNLVVQGNRLSECHGYTYELGFLQLNGVLVQISPVTEEFGKRQNIVSSRLTEYCRECDVMEFISPILSSDHDFLGLLCFLLDSLTLILSSSTWTYVITSAIHVHLNRISNVDVLSDSVQAEPDVKTIQRILTAKHGQNLISQEQLERIITATIRSYVNSAEIISLFLHHYNTILINDAVTVVSLSETAINVPYVRSAYYIQMFMEAARIKELNVGDISRLVHSCLKSQCDQSRSLDIILSYCPDNAARKRILNEELMDSIRLTTLRNPSTLHFFLRNKYLLNDGMIFTSLAHHTFHLFCKNKKLEQQIKISFDKGTDDGMIFVKLLQLYLMHHCHSNVFRMHIGRLPYGKDRTVEVRLTYKKHIMLTVQLMYSSLPGSMVVDATEVIINIVPEKGLSSSNIVNLSLKAIETEENVNSIILILYDFTETVQLSDEELQLLFCAMINRKHTGRENYVRSLLSSPMYSGISEKSVTQILRTAMVKQRNNVTIIDLFLCEAERCGIFLSEPSMKLLISDLCECRHKRTVLYLRKLLQSVITPVGLSDNVFVAALTSYLRVKNESSEVLSFLKENKTELSQNCLCMLEKLKSDIQQNSVRDEDDDIDDDDDDNDEDDFSEKRKEEMKRKSKVIDDIIDFHLHSQHQEPY